jgi:hypothetical protein
MAATIASGDAFATAQMVKFNVPQNLRAGLLYKVDHGETLDSETGIAPLSSSTSVVDGSDVTTARWADGSFKSSAVQLAAPAAASSAAQAVTPFSVSGCTYTVAEGVGIRSGCNISQDEVDLTMSFKATYEQWSGGSQIDSVSSWDAQTIGATYSFQSFGITRKTGITASTPATARLRITTNVAGIASTSPYLQLNVKPGDVNATSSSNW